jgi:enolase
LQNGSMACASVPSGASTGRAEALELRDKDPARYRGLGCRQAVRNIEEVLDARLREQSFTGQKEFDAALLKLDGTPNKARLGANAILAVSLAFARAAALEQAIPLYRYLALLTSASPSTLPRPTINLFSGGKHAGGQCALQDVLLVPASARTMDEALAMTFAVYQCATELTAKKYNARPLRADEGGLAPPFLRAQDMLEDAIEAIQQAGLAPGRDVFLAVDVASSHFFQNGFYQLDGRRLDSAGMIDQLVRWVGDYPIVSLEDGLAEEDWAHWPTLTQQLKGKCRIVGDDLLCTNPERIRRAVKERAADTLLLKVNQIGTLTEALEAWQIARQSQWQVTVSARSGETEDDWLADLAVGWAGDQIKVGSITQSERLSKYNRLLTIERETRLPLVRWPQVS